MNDYIQWVKRAEEAEAEVRHLRAENLKLLRFVVQKCPRCGIVVAPDPSKEWPVPAHIDGCQSQENGA